MPTNSTTSPTTKLLLGCSKCGATLPDEAQFCLKCGKPVSSPAKEPTVWEVIPRAKLPQPKRKRRIFLWILLVVLVGVIVWAVTSDSSGAQQLQESVGLKQDRVILDSSFSVGSHSFRYYKFALPEGSVNVGVVGEFTCTQEGLRSNNRKDKGDKSTIDREKNNDSSIEVFVLTDSAFTIWQNGYATSSLYESGKVAEGTVQAEIPAGAGIYYLVFSNKAAPKTPKTVHANLLLRYKSWLPDWFRRMKGRVMDWVGL
jgi:predicted nucleic acid-binding Zn ribbon protein